NTITISPLGEAVGQFYGHEMDGIFTTMDDINNSALPVEADGTPVPIDEDTGIWLGDIKWKDQLTVDTDGDGIPDAGDGVINEDDKTTIGNPHPDFTFSLANNLRYKDFDLSISLLGSYGNDNYNWTRRLGGEMRETMGNECVRVLDRYIEGINENTNIPRFVNGEPNDNSRVSSRFVEDGSYLRIQNITLGYTFPA